MEFADIVRRNKLQIEGSEALWSVVECNRWNSTDAIDTKLVKGAYAHEVNDMAKRIRKLLMLMDDASFRLATNIDFSVNRDLKAAIKGVLNDNLVGNMGYLLTDEYLNKSKAQALAAEESIFARKIVPDARVAELKEDSLERVTRLAKKFEARDRKYDDVIGMVPTSGIYWKLGMPGPRFGTALNKAFHKLGLAIPNPHGKGSLVKEDDVQVMEDLVNRFFLLSIKRKERNLHIASRISIDLISDAFEIIEGYVNNTPESLGYMMADDYLTRPIGEIWAEEVEGKEQGLKTGTRKPEATKKTAPTVYITAPVEDVINVMKDATKADGTTSNERARFMDASSSTQDPTLAQEIYDAALNIVDTWINNLGQSTTDAALFQKFLMLADKQRIEAFQERLKGSRKLKLVAKEATV